MYASMCCTGKAQGCHHGPADRGERARADSERYPLQSTYTSPTSRTNTKSVLKQVKKPLTMKHCTSIIDGLKAIYFNKVGPPCQPVSLAGGMVL